MSQQTQTPLSPLEKAVRNCLVVYLYQLGCSINSIARVMNMHQSTVSRVVTKGEYKDVTLIDLIVSSK